MVHKPVIAVASPTVLTTEVHVEICTASCDVFVGVTAEYNHGYTAGLRHAIDLARQQWQAKPVAFVPYGGASGGFAQ